MIKRILYTTSKMIQQWSELKNYRNNSKLQIKNVLELNPIEIKEQGIKCLALDMDGVLTAYGEEKLSPSIATWLDHCLQIFGYGKVFILSNKSTLGRIEYFSKKFKGLGVMVPERKKPYPDGIQQILQLTKIKAQELLVIDDRLLTGILAAILVNVPARYVTKPMINLHSQTMTELFFIGLRTFEKALFRMI